MSSSNVTQTAFLGFPKGVSMVGTIVIALLIAFLAATLLAIFVYGAGRLCPCPCLPMSMTRPRRGQQRWGDSQSLRHVTVHNMRQPNNASVDSVTLAVRGVIAPPPAYHYPFTYPPNYPGSFVAASDMERGRT